MGNLTRKGRGATVGVALAGTIAMCAAAPAPAATKYASKVTLSNGFPAFHGNVRSRGGEICVEDRRIRLFTEMPGGDMLIGKGRTNGRGRWKIPMDPSRGEFYAKVKGARGVSPAVGTIRCMSDVSKSVVID